MKDHYCAGCNTVYVRETEERMLPLDYVVKHDIDNLADGAKKSCSGCRPGVERRLQEMPSDLE